MLWYLHLASRARRWLSSTFRFLNSLCSSALEAFVQTTFCGPVVRYSGTWPATGHVNAVTRSGWAEAVAQRSRTSREAAANVPRMARMRQSLERDALQLKQLLLA